MNFSPHHWLCRCLAPDAVCPIAELYQFPTDFIGISGSVGCGDEGTASIATDAVRKLTASYDFIPAYLLTVKIYQELVLEAV